MEEFEVWEKNTLFHQARYDALDLFARIEKLRSSLYDKEEQYRPSNSTWYVRLRYTESVSNYQLELYREYLRTALATWVTEFPNTEISWEIEGWVYLYITELPEE